MNDEQVVIDDSEMPSAPSSEAAGEVVEIDGSVDGSVFATVHKEGDALPMGTYHFRLSNYTQGWNEFGKDDKGKTKEPELESFGKQPYFMVNWVCQQEPHTGRQIPPEFVGWCTPELFKAATEGNRSAAKYVANRLIQALAILEGAEMKPTGSFNFKDFLGTNPEMKLTLGLGAGKTKDQSGKYVNDGRMVNKVLKHVSLRRPS